jgi:hypothetical protein
MATTQMLARQVVRGLGEQGVTTRIPNEVRGAVLAYANEAWAGGETWAGIAEQIGLSATALPRWSRGRREREREEEPVRLLPVCFSSEPVFEAATGGTGTGLTLSTPHGERLEGLDVAEAIELLRALR